jgi:hypothetical protein
VITTETTSNIYTLPTRWWLYAFDYSIEPDDASGNDVPNDSGSSGNKANMLKISVRNTINGGSNIYYYYTNPPDKAAGEGQPLTPEALRTIKMNARGGQTVIILLLLVLIICITISFFV